MPGFRFNKVEGREGSVTIPRIGALIGTMQSWRLNRRGDDGPSGGLFDLRAVFSYVNPHLFNDPEYAPDLRIRIQFSRGKEYECEVQSGSKVVLEGRSLVIEGVKLCLPE